MVAEYLSWPLKADEDAEVGLAHQPSWPFEPSICASYSVVVAEAEEEGASEAPMVYVVEGSQRGYLPGDAKEACRY